MAKAVTLDTPFRRGEKVVTTRDLPGIPEGTRGKVRLANGLKPGLSWQRYWVRFTDGRLVGQIDHDALVRPDMVDEWAAAKEAEAARAEAAAAGEAEGAAAADAGGGGGGGGGIADQIPAAILERSRAAKARLLG